MFVRKCILTKWSRPIARWRRFTITTRILQGTALFWKLRLLLLKPSLFQAFRRGACEKLGRGLVFLFALSFYDSELASHHLNAWNRLIKTLLGLPNLNRKEKSEMNPGLSGNNGAKPGFLPRLGQGFGLKATG